MSAKNLSAVASELITSYGNTAGHIINAYEAGGERMVSLLEQRWNQALKQSRSELSAETVKNASAAQLVFSVYFTKGLNLTTSGGRQVVNQLVKLIEAGVARVAANARAFEEKAGMTTLDMLAKASSLSDLGIVGCKSTAAVCFSPFSYPISRYWDAKTSKTILAGADFRFRRPKSDRLLACPARWP